jgi:C4-dicarboxylate transporter, DctM subunit
MSATIVIVIAAATAFGQILTLEKIPVQVAEFLTGISSNTIIIIMMISILLLVVGYSWYLIDSQQNSY